MMEDDTDRALAAKDARIAELEEAHTDLLADFIMRNRDRFDAHRAAIKAEVALSLVEAEARDLRAALEAEKAARVKAEAALRAIVVRGGHSHWTAEYVDGVLGGGTSSSLWAEEQERIWAQDDASVRARGGGA